LNEAQKKQEIQLNVANGLWAQKGNPFLPAFLDIARKQYEANVNQSDFRTSAEAVRHEINDWVGQKTKGKITDLIPQGMLTPMTRLVLVNAIYFKGRWSTQFKKTSTTNAPFSVTGVRKVQAPLMNITENFNYAEPEGLQVLELPYVGNDVSMVVLLPRENDGLKTLENSLTAPKLYEWLGLLHSQKVNVFLPKFKLTDQFSLVKTLASMGMLAPFSPQADFSGMDGGHDLFISDVVHKAYVDVNEEGTEAAAATGVGMHALAVRRPEPVPVFRADHPFIFLIRDTRSGSILFLGRLVDPTK
jgi:serpin B